MDRANSEFSLSIFLATPAQVLESRNQAFAEWGGGMTHEQYMCREEDLSSLDHANNGKLITWVLAPRNEPNTLDFNCSCRTYQRMGLMLQTPVVNAAGSQFGPIEVTCYGIAAVLTPPSKRGRGYARHMMRLLHWVLAPESSLPEVFHEKWGAPPLKAHRKGNAQFSALWSDIGPRFYQRCGPGPDNEQESGWMLRQCVSTTWQVFSRDKGKEYSEGGNEWELLDEEGVRQIWQRDVQWIKNDMVAAAIAQACGHAWFTFLPDQGVGAFQHERSTFFLDPELILTKHSGVASLGISTLSDPSFDDEASFATWTLDLRSPPPRTLVVTRLRANQQTFRGLLDQILNAAMKFGMEKVEIWNLPRELEDTAKEQGGVTQQRNEHLSAFKWYGKEDGKDLTWLFNEK